MKSVEIVMRTVAAIVRELSEQERMYQLQEDYLQACRLGLSFEYTPKIVNILP